MNKRDLFVALLATLFLAQFSMAAWGQENIIQKRIDSASAGDTIVVPFGTYRGNLHLRKKLTLIGVDHPVIMGDGKGTCIEVSADSCIVQGFRIINSGMDLRNDHSGILVRGNRNRIADNILEEVLFGIYLLNADHNWIEGNAIWGNNTLEIGSRGSGIHLFNSNANVLEGNSIREMRDGFYLQYANGTNIAGNVVQRLRYGIHYMYADSNVFTFNLFSHNVAGAAIMYSKAISFKHNAFVSNRGFSSYGILFQDCHNVQADSNVIADNVIGLFFESSTLNSFKHNLIAKNDIAFQMFQNSHGNVFTENAFVDNLKNLSVIGKRTRSSWDYFEKGNYWDAHRGYDLDGDGIGDEPMKITDVFGYLESRHAAFRILFYSPSMQALQFAMEAMPFMELSEECDRFPLMVIPPLRNLPALSLNPEKEVHKTSLWGVASAAFLLLSVGIVVSYRKERG